MSTMVDKHHIGPDLPEDVREFDFVDETETT